MCEMFVCARFIVCTHVYLYGAFHTLVTRANEAVMMEVM